MQDAGARLTAAECFQGLKIALFSGAARLVTGDMGKLCAFNPNKRRGNGNLAEHQVLELMKSRR